MIMNKSGLEELISKCPDNGYTFEHAFYVNCKTKIRVTCHKKDECGVEHGDFWIRPDHLRKGVKCPKCSGYYTPTTEEWIAKAKLVHGNDRYDYSKMGEYTGNSNDFGTFICHEKDEDGVEHGEFVQRFRLHLRGSGCPICGGSQKMTKEDFVKRARKTHGDRYDYDNFVYVNATTKGWVTCKEHGDFLQTPYQHIKGQGCPCCKNSVLEERLHVSFDANLIYHETWNYVEGLGRQSIDFYLPQKKLYIECQGEQHYAPTKFQPSMSDEKALEEYHNRVVLDRQKYDVITNAGYQLIYYTDPNTFHVKDIDVFAGWYSDKKVFTHIHDLLDYISTLPNYKYTPKEKVIKRKKSVKKRIHWTYELCKEEASKYKTRTEFEKGNQSAYVAARRNGWLNDFMGALNKPRGYWNNKDRVIAAAKECTGARDMYSKYPAAYSSAVRKGWLNDLVYNVCQIN